MILTCGAWFVPESPRWLIEVGKKQAGRSVLTRLHLNRDATNNQLVEHELNQIHESVSHERRSVNRSWHQLLTSRHWRYQVLLACGLQAFTQLSGANVIQSYGPLLYESLGLSISTSLMIIGVWGALAQLWNTIFMAFIDKIGRRKLLIPSLLGIGAALCIEATLARYVDFSDANTNKDALRAAIAMFFVFSFFYTALGLISCIYPSEIFPTAMRATGSSMATATNWVLNLILAQCSPIALTHIGSKYFYVFVGFTWAAAVLVWVWYPETIGHSLEEVQGVFILRLQSEQPEFTRAVGPPPARPIRSHFRPKVMDPLSMHPTTSGCWSSDSGSSPKPWSRQTDEV